MKKAVLSFVTLMFILTSCNNKEIVTKQEVFSDEFQNSFKVYQFVKSINRSGTCAEDTFIQKELQLSTAAFNCAKDAKNLPEVLAAAECNIGGTECIVDSKEFLSPEGKILLKKLDDCNHAITETIRGKSVFQKAVEKISHELVYSTKLNADNETIIRVRLKNAIDTYNNETIALYLHLFSDSDDFIDDSDLKKIVTRFKVSDSYYYRWLAWVYDDTGKVAQIANM